jgi:hypothetical protein
MCESSRAVWKWELLLTDVVQWFPMSRDARIVHVGSQGGVIFLWAEVVPSGQIEMKSRRGFRVFGTGHSISGGFAYVGTAVIGSFVWHVYEVTDG